MPRPRLLPPAALLALAASACGDAAAPADTRPLRFDARPAPVDRSAVYPVSVTVRSGRAVEVRGGFFVGAPGYELEARLSRPAPDTQQLEVLAARRAGAAAEGASHFDYEAFVPVAAGDRLTVVHRVEGAGVDTVFSGRVEQR